MSEIRKNIALALAATLLSIFAAEIILRSTGTFKTYSERNKGLYLSPYGYSLKTPWLLLRPPNWTGVDRCPEFQHDFHTNSEGVRDREHQVDKPSGVYRIILLGDSFTEGVGVDFKDSLGPLLQDGYSKLNCTKQIEVLTVGVAGSDPALSYQLLRRRYLKYRPDLVVLITNRTDVEDYVTRGGMERFKDDGQVTIRPSPPIEPFFRWSHLMRGILIRIFRYNWLLLSPSDQWRAYRAAALKLADTFVVFEQLAETEHFQFAVARLPVYPQLWPLPHPVDEMPQLLPALQRQGVRFVDLLPMFKTRIDPVRVNDFIWPVNNHLREAGYLVFVSIMKPILARTPDFPSCAEPNRAAGDGL